MQRCINLVYLRGLRDDETNYCSDPSVTLPLTMETGVSRCAAYFQDDLTLWLKQPPLLSQLRECVTVAVQSVLGVAWYHSNTGATLKLQWLTGRALKCERSI